MAQRYTVTYQNQTTELTPRGTFRDVMEVGFNVIGAGDGVIKVPLELYSVDTVRDAIEAHVEHMIGVAEL